MNDMFRRQVETESDFRVTSLTAPEGSASLDEVWPSSTVDGACRNH